MCARDGDVVSISDDVGGNAAVEKRATYCSQYSLGIAHNMDKARPL
jgi:hypothetical protein